MKKDMPSRRDSHRPGYSCLALIWLLACASLGGYFIWTGLPSNHGDGKSSAVKPTVAVATQPKYRTKNIEDIKAGDRVAAYDPATGQ